MARFMQILLKLEVRTESLSELDRRTNGINMKQRQGLHQKPEHF